MGVKILVGAGVSHLRTLSRLRDEKGLFFPNLGDEQARFLVFVCVFDQLRRILAYQVMLFEFSLLFFHLFNFDFINSKNQIFKSSFHLLSITKIKNNRHRIEFFIAFLIIHLANNIFSFI